MQRKEVKNDGDTIVLDFEITPRLKEDFQRNFGWWIYTIKKFLRNNLFIINTIIFSTGFVYTLFSITNSFSVINYAILMLYIAQVYIRTLDK